MSFILPSPQIYDFSNPFSQTAFLQWLDKIAQHSRTNYAIVTQTSAFTIGAQVGLARCDATGGAFAANLPASAGENSGREIGFIKVDPSANAVTVTAAGSDLMNGSATIALSNQYDFVVVKDNGSGWEIVDSNLLSQLSGTLGVAHGGTGAATLTAHGILLGEGTSAVVPTAAMTDGQLLVGQTSADPLPKTMSGDAVISKTGAVTLQTSGLASLGAVPTSRTITTSNGIQGGGDLSANRTFSLDINGPIQDASPDDAADFVPTYDASAATTKKVLLAYLAKSFLSFGGTTVTQGNTYYGGGPVQFQTSDPNLARMVVTRNQTISRLFVKATSAPGSGQTFIATLQKNGVDTALTATIADTNTSASDTSHAIAFSAGDDYTLKLVTSAGTAASDVSCAVEVQMNP